MATNSLTRNSRGSDLAVNHLIDIFLSSIILQEGVISLWAQNMKPLRTVQVRRVPRAPLFYFPLILFNLLSYVMNSSLLELINLC